MIIDERIKAVTEEVIIEYNLPNYGVLFGRLDKKIYDQILEQCYKLREENRAETNYKANLAGHLTQEYNLLGSHEILIPKLTQMVDVYSKKYKIFESTDWNLKNKKITLESIWVNFMYKNDFNPLHGHSGIMSFVIWMKIPYDIKNELGIYPEANGKQTSCFSFSYGDILGQRKTTEIPVDKDYEGIICIFPSKLQHFVNPFFTSDEPRISISGNFSVEDHNGE